MTFQGFVLKKIFSQNFVSPTLSWTNNFQSTIFFQRENFFSPFPHETWHFAKKKFQWKFSKSNFVLDQKFSKFNFVLDQEFSKSNIVLDQKFSKSNFVLDQKFSKYKFFFKWKFFFTIPPSNMTFQGFLQNKIFSENILSPTLSWTRNFLSPTLSWTKNFLSAVVSWTKNFLSPNFFQMQNFFSPFLHQTWHFKDFC